MPRTRTTRTRRNSIAAALVVTGALGTFCALTALLAPGTPTADAEAVADRVLGTARRSDDPAAIAQRVADALPAGSRAVVVRPARANEPSSRTGTPEVAVLVGEADLAAASLLVSNGGVVGAHATPDGWWAAVAVPATVRPPVGAALGLVVGAALLGAAAAELPRPRPGARDRDVLARGLSALAADVPGLAREADHLLVAAGLRRLVPDGRSVDRLRHHVVGTERTRDGDLVDTVARTVRPGYADGTRTVVRPRVVAYVRD
ncbi:hypothetical protein AB0I60_24240 [Actinosynnema sp. NPDC050436]|uniref:hypothetical protein n=1 Tax=Actinosynnema sp. NPDC050436 TaxID=3155659 RepID=UPI0033E5E86C